MIRWAKNRNDWDPHRSRQVHDAAIIRDQQIALGKHRRELRDGSASGKVEGRSRKVFANRTSQPDFVWTAHQDDFGTLLLQRSSDGRKAGNRPAAGPAKGAATGVNGNSRLAYWHVALDPIFGISLDCIFQWPWLSPGSEQCGDGERVFDFVEGTEAVISEAMG
jgi:hypothetical protein